MQIVLTPDIIRAAYSQGLFPMAERSHSPYVHWFCPEKRGQMSIEALHIPKRLKKTILQSKVGGMPYEVRINSDFHRAIQSCANKMPERPETWINDQIRDVFCKLHNEGSAHSVECWQNGEMVGGLYGLSLGGAFFGESMFSHVTDASKICLVHLAARLWSAGYTVLDTQFLNPHLLQFGAYEISYKVYMEQLTGALKKNCVFTKEQNEKALVRIYFDMQDKL